MWSALASISLGIIGWCIARLLFEPLKEIVDLRREVQENLILRGNLAKDAPEDERRAASDAFRRLGAGLVARHLAAYCWVKSFYRMVLRWNIHRAGALLISVGNSLQFEESGLTLADDGLSTNVKLIRQELRLRSWPGETR
jgi:HAMP domain-containing protein